MLACLLLSAIAPFSPCLAAESQEVHSTHPGEPRSSSRAEGKPRMQTVVCIGDSITVGARLSQPQHTAWPQQLAARLNVEYDYPHFSVVPIAAGGATLLRNGDTPIWKKRAFQTLDRVVPDQVVIMLGTNDTVQAGRENWAKAAEWEDDLEALIARIHERRPEASILLAGPPPMFPDQAGLATERSEALQIRKPRLIELQERNAAFAAKHDGVDYLDLNGVLMRGRTSDGVHPNSFGHEAIARAVHQSLAERLGLRFDPRASMQAAPSAEYRAGAGWQGGTWADAFARLRKLGVKHCDSPLVFFGDSITQGLTGDADRVAHASGERAIDQVFGKWNALSLGLSGDRTEHLRYRLRHGALRSMSPRVIVLQIGINNLNAAKHSPADTAAGIHAVVADLRAAQPWAKILVCGPFPAGRTPDAPLRQSVDAVHQAIQGIAEGTESALHGGARQVHYLDLRPLFLNEDGSPGPRMGRDALHINGQGQQAWMEAIRPWVEAELEQASVPNLPAELAWLVENQDYPRVSRSLLCLAPDQSGPRRRAQPILYSFDAHDQLELGYSKGAWIFNGPLAETRSSPNVGTPLHCLRADGDLHGSNLGAPLFATSSDSTLVAYANPNSVGIFDTRTGMPSELLSKSELGRTMPTSIHWLPQGRILLALGPIAGGPVGNMRPGLWSIDPNTAEAERIADRVGQVEAVLDAHTLLVSRPAPAPGSQGSLTYAPRELLLLDLSEEKAPPQSILRGVRAKTELAAIDDGSFLWVNQEGRIQHSAGPRASEARRAELARATLLSPAHLRVIELAQCQGWIAYSAVDQEHRREIYLHELASAREYRLGPGLRPRWAN